MPQPLDTTQKHAIVAVRLSADAEAVSRREQFMGRTFRVVPAVLVQSQVLHNNLGASYLPATAFTEDWANVWNGIPVLVGPHPARRGHHVSGRDADLWDARGAGWLFNVKASNGENGTRRLTGEVWLDEGRAGDVPGLAEVFTALDNGQPVELSTGFPATVETQHGVVNGTPFELVMAPQGADHLVISTEMTGACSVADGCGLGVRNFKELQMPAPAGTPEPVADTGFIAKVQKKLTAWFAAPTSGDEATEFWATNTARQAQRLVDALHAAPLSDQELASQIGQALRAKHGADGCDCIVVDVYSAAKEVVFYLHTPLGPNPRGNEYFKASFTENADGSYTFGDPVKVRRMTVYEPVTGQSGAVSAANSSPAPRPCGCGSHNTRQEDTMDAKEKEALIAEIGTGVAAQIANALKPFSEKLEGVVAAATDAATQAVEKVRGEFTTQFKELSEKVESVQKVANADRDAERQALITELSTNNRTPFTAADLEAKPLEDLRKLAVMAKVDVTSYAGRGAPRSMAGNAAGDEPAYLEPRPYHTANAAGAKGADKKES